MKRIVSIALVFGVGVIVGAVAMEALELHVRPTYRDVMRANFVAEQEFLAARADRAGDHMRAVSHLWNVVDAGDASGFRIFRRDWGDDSDPWLPWRLLVLARIVAGLDDGRGRQLGEALHRARLALALEAMQEHEAASEQWELAAHLSNRSKDSMRSLAEMLAQNESSELHRQAEAAILDGVNAR